MIGMALATLSGECAVIAGLRLQNRGNFIMAGQTFFIGGRGKIIMTGHAVFGFRNLGMSTG